MDNRIISSISIVFIVILIFLIQVLTPRLTRKEIYFGIRIPKNQLESEKLKNIYKKYVTNNIIVSIPYIIIVFLLCYYLNAYFEILNVVLILAYLIISFFVYFIANKEVKKVKNELNWGKTKKSVVVIDTNFTKEKNKSMLVSPSWFLIPLFMIVINLYIGYRVYHNLPDIVPTHFDFAGEANGWTPKSYKLIIQMPAVQLFMTIIMFFSYKIIGWSKQQISASDPKASKERNKIFRYRWSAYMILMAIAINILFTVGNLSILQVIKMSAKTSMIVIFTITMLIIVSSIVMSVKTGQGGSKIKVGSMDEENEKVQDRDDDKYWKLANSIYVNKDDPAIFVEKRFGIGWTMNFGNTKSIIIAVVFIILMIALPILIH
ncbi:hypothetical protein Ccar_15195 [Clostridium carboxidivorans P7]|uniref:DUF1648 domain-containing protein n=1 Tax=Clostridium carboxidivorans P7 TaxID=536227 RepID=C6Q004_9CLOT|nr:DUF5808 domain-containing protein [Clostridium carboxidivorans]AKN32135.1 hypothetical protein Ccar_15195 [Clostridium carboxidivorans P7]EET85178.1 protein of unknown function DUF1648 [Clostridium carboxidivorans P7]